MNKKFVCAVLVVILLASTMLLSETHTHADLTGEIKLGAMLPLTGDLATFGENHNCTAQLAVEEVNDFLGESGASWTMTLVVEDTQTDPSIALEKLEILAAMGIKLNLGPLSSAEVRAIKPYCNSNQILAISPSSTAPDLAIPDDYIFRFCPQDKTGQGPAIGSIMYDDGKRYAVPVTRNDSLGVGLEEAVELKFEGLGGTFLTGIRYDPGETDFSDEAAALAEIVTDAVSTYGTDQVAVLHISSEEVNDFMTACLAYAVLEDVKWYGSDGTACNGAMLEDSNVRDFAMAVGYPCTSFAPTESAKYERIRQHCIDVLEREPDVYAYIAYDIVWVYALDLLEVDAYDSEAVKAVLHTITQNYFGASGWIELDENGDNAYGEYNIWAITEVAPGEYDWAVIGRYVTRTPRIYVDDDNTWGPWDGSSVHPYQNITSALQHASVNDTIYVYNGTYRENVVIDTTLTLMGESRSNTIINGSGLSYEGALVKIRADDVDMSGFTVTNANLSGIEVEERQYCEVHDNIVCFTGDRGIVFGSGGNNIAYNNVVYNSSAYGGIEAIYSDNNTIYNNLAYFNQWGIATNHGSYNHIYNNTVHSNGVGIHIDWPSTGNIIHNNDISSNTNAGIRVINQANETVISGNKISENYCGIQLVNSPRNTISGNYITNNAAAVAIISSENNSFYHNNFINNGWQVYIDPPSCVNFWDDGYPSGGNYWSDYTGVDLYSGPYQNETGSDGIGDVPYTINANNTDGYPLMRALYYESAMTQVVSTESTATSLVPSLAVDSHGNVHIAWYDYTDYAGSGTDADIFYKKFVVDSGWTNTEVVSTESTGDSLHPSLAVDLAGNVHIAWEDLTNYTGCGTDYDIFYKRYEVGSDWTPTEVVSTESTEISWNPSLAVDSGGDIHVAWWDGTDYDGCGTDIDIFYKKTYRMGAGWNLTEVVSTNSTEISWNPSLAVDLAGNVHIAWEDYTDYDGCGTDDDIFYRRYEVDSGWTSTQVVSTESNDVSYWPSLAVDSSRNVHIAWYDKTNYSGCGTDYDIFYKRYEGGDVGWTSTEVVSTESTGDSLHPSLAVDSAGNVHIAWYDATDYAGSGTDIDIFYKRHEVGVGWIMTHVVSTESTGNSYSPSLAVDSSRNVHVAWHDDTEYAGCGSDTDIFYKYLRLHSTQYPWPMFRHNPRHTGYTESPAPNTNQTLWNYTTGGWVESSSAVVDGIVFVGSNDGNVYALDQHTGAKIWNYSTGSPVYSSPAVAYGKVYVGSPNNKVYCLDASTGELIWNYTTWGSIRSSPAVTDDKVYVGSDGDDGRVYCLDALTGEPIWNYTTYGGWIYTSSPSVAGGRVFVGSDNGKVYCLDASTGTHVWNYTTGDWVYSSPAVAYGKVYVGSYDNKVYCLNAATGEPIWNYTTLGNVHSSPAVAYGRVYVGSGDGRVYCLNASTRAHIWNYTTGGPVYSSPAVADGKVYVGSFDEKVYCLDASTRAHIWNYTTGGPVYSSPAVADGIVFVGSNDQTVYAFGNIIRVPEDYPTITEAIDAADPGATIIIAPGTYHESLVIDKPLTIIGTKGSSSDFAGGGSGIAVNITNTSQVTVTNVVVTNWDQGIFIDNSSDCKIYNNIMYLMDDSGIALEGNNAANNLIDSNTIYANNIAIDLTESSTSNTIYNNTISLNNIGLNLESGGNTVYANTISGNEVGINMTDSNDNTIYWNSFIDNTYAQVSTSNSVNNIWDNGYEGNYWSNYAGTDADGDGIGDTPHIVDGNNQDNYPLMSPYEYWSNPILGDINRDMKVDYEDLSHLATAYGSTQEKPNWNSNCDLNKDNKIEALDLYGLSKNYGKTHP